MGTTAIQIGFVIAGLASLALGVFGGGVLRSPAPGAMGRIRRGVGIFLAVVGLYFVVGGLTEVRAPAKVTWSTDEATALQTARREGRPVFIDFYADWCEACKALDHKFFTRDDIAHALQPYVLLRADMTANDDAATDMQERYGVTGLPTLVLVPPDGDPSKAIRLTSKARQLQEPASLIATLRGFAAGPDNSEHDATNRGGEATATTTTGFAATLESALSGPLLIALLLVFIGGILSSFTPCVYPLIPITVAVFGARHVDSRGQAFRLSTVYVGGMALTYSLLGTVAASAGSLFGSVMQNPWVIGGIALLFILMGLSMLGLFEFRLPAGLQTALSQSGGKGYLGALVMGLVAGIVAAPCVGPVLVVLLAYVAGLGNPVVGFLIMLAYALGMGLLFLLIGTFSGLLGRLPKSGPWMDGVKAAFGIIFLTLALWYLKDAFPLLKAVFPAVQAALQT